jgi:RNA polymerase sigma-70 factor (ECF subfamily)
MRRVAIAELSRSTSGLVSATRKADAVGSRTHVSLIHVGTQRDQDRWKATAALVRRATAGDQGAFAELLQDHRDAITSTLFACGVRQRETARDLAQDVALRAWNRLPDLKDPRTFTAWVRRIAANAARDHLRRMAVRREDELDAALHLESDDDPHSQAERLSEVRLMLTVLDSEDTEVVELMVARANGESVASIAERMSLSEGALKMRLMRVRKRLRTRLEELRKGG